MDSLPLRAGTISGKTKRMSLRAESFSSSGLLGASVLPPAFGPSADLFPVFMLSPAPGLLALMAKGAATSSPLDPGVLLRFRLLLPRLFFEPAELTECCPTFSTSDRLKAMAR